MAKSTFSGPVKSLNGFISSGSGAVVSLTADTSLTVDDHAGRVLVVMMLMVNLHYQQLTHQAQAILQIQIN